MRRSIALALAAFLCTSGPVLAVTGGRVWVEPFTVVGDQQPPQLAAQADWMNNALRQSVADDLASIPGITVAQAPASGAAAAAPTTQPADYVVSGTIQRVDGDLRVTGRVVDTSANKTVGGFKATGAERDLFAIEDSIAAQLKAALAPPPPPAAPAVASTTSAGAATPQAANATNPFAGARGGFEGSELQRALEERDYLRQLQQQSTAITYNSAPFDYSGGYNQPYYQVPGGYVYDDGYGYYGPGWYGGGVIVINQNRGHDHDHDHDHHFDHGHGSTGGSSSGGFTRPAFSASQQNEGIRRASSWAGNPPSTFVNTAAQPNSVPTGGPQLVPGGIAPGQGTGPSIRAVNNNMAGRNTTIGR